jgi:hypothetical protein
MHGMLQQDEKQPADERGLVGTTATGVSAPAARDAARSGPRGLARWTSERGAATAEYAIVIMAAVGFAGLLVVIMRSGEVQAILTDLVRNALSLG